MMNSIKKPLRKLLLVLPMLLMLFPVAAQPPMDAEWKAVWETLDDMPVQSGGIVRSYRTFCHYTLAAITDESSYKGADAVAAITWFLSDGERFQSLDLMPVGHPEIGKLFKKKLISYVEYYEKYEELDQMVNTSNEESLRISFNRLRSRANAFYGLPEMLNIIPQDSGWLSPYEITAQHEARHVEITERWSALLDAVAANDASAALEAAVKLKQSVTDVAGPDAIQKIGLDAAYTRFQPFKKAALFYILAAVAYAAGLIVSIRKRNEVLPWVGLGLMLVGLVIQSSGIGMRWIISGRAPLSDMYETMIFGIAGLVLAAAIIEVLTRMRFLGLICSVLGFLFVVVAHKHPIFDSQIDTLMPALQSFWLTYHVVTVMLSYSCFLLSALFAGIYLLGFAKNKLEVNEQVESFKSLMIPSLATLDTLQYRLVAVGFPLLTLGIILGAVWGERAWGRPWGFDPKETWSAITWMVYAAYLHVRFMRGWRGALAAAVCLFGFACVLFTWFGVNALLPSIHSYA